MILNCFSKQSFSSRFPNCVDLRSVQLWNLRQERLVKFLKVHLVKFLKTCSFQKPSQNAYDLSKFLAPVLCSQVLMSAAESLGSHQLNSFAAFLEEKLHTSSENSIVQIPQLKNMADGKKPQKGGKKPEVMTAFEIPEEIYADYCTPDEAKFGKENKNQRKVRIQKIERRWAREWREYRYVTPKYMKKFALNPPCPRAPLAPGQVADPTSIKRGEDFPEEWAKRQAKLARQAKEAVKKFNEDSATATATEASVKPRKSMPKKPARKPSASPTVPSRPSSSAAPSRQIPHTATAPPKSSAPVLLATCQRTAGFSIASGVSSRS